MTVHLRSVYVLAAKHLYSIEVMSFSASIQTTVNLPIVRQLGTLQKKHRSFIEIEIGSVPAVIQSESIPRF